MKNVMQLKFAIKNVAKDNNISAQLVLQNFMMERLLERISLSQYRNNFILKGGFLIAAMVGLNTRSTMDMDATIKGIAATELNLQEMFLDICKLELNDDVSFRILNINEIRGKDEYGGFRLTLSADFPPMAVPIKIDITTGDKLTPSEIVFDFELMFEERNISVLAYNLETILAEKLETIISRADQNTRARDFYDVYILNRVFSHLIDIDTLREALIATASKRNTLVILKNYLVIITIVRESIEMQKYWLNYQRQFEYATEITFDEICDVILEISSRCIDD